MPKTHELPFMLPQANEHAGQLDLLFSVLNFVAIFFSIGIFVAVVVLAIRYAQGRRAYRSNPPEYNLWVEIIWTGIPLVIAMGLFAWGALLFLEYRRTPAGAMPIYVVGKQWMWKMQHPEGRWENNELHVPVGRPIELIMTSEDVIHAFFVPAFRLKMDVIPGEYTRMWFKATKVGEYPLLCAEFCGTLHSKMTGTVHVMEQADYEKWLQEGSRQPTLATLGGRLFRKHGCSGCHGASSRIRAPALEGIYGSMIPIQVPTGREPLEKTPAKMIRADDRYIHDAIVLPEKEVAAGYAPIMPTYKNRLTEEEVFQLTAYIKSLATVREKEPSRPGPGTTEPLSADEYRARTGFSPENLLELQRLAEPQPGGARRRQ